MAFDSGIDRLDSGVCERGGDKREGFAFFNITRLTSFFFKHLEARERSGGTLHIRVYGGAATELQHLEPLVLERINGHFGYRAVAKLRLIHAPLSGRSERVAEPKDSELPPLDSQSAAELDALLAIVDDPELRASLGRIGRAIMARSAAATRR